MSSRSALPERPPISRVGLLIILGGALILVPVVMILTFWLWVLVGWGGLASAWSLSGILIAFGAPAALAALGISFILYGARVTPRARH